VRPVLITAGATRNPIDAMRFISANASGTTGAWLAEQLGSGGVTLMGSPIAALRAPDGMDVEVFGSTEDLMRRMERWVTHHADGIVVPSAAVGDYAVRQPQGNAKIASGQADLTLELVPTPKILDQIKAWGASVFLVSFKAAAPGTSPEDLIRIASAQHTRSHSDLVFGNVIDHVDREVIIVESGAVQSFSERTLGLAALLDRLTQERRGCVGE